MKDLLIATQFLEKAPIIILTLNADHTVGFINDWGCQLLTCNKADVLGRDWFGEFVVDENLAYVKEFYAAIMRGEAVLIEQYENEIRATNGNIHLISWNSKLLLDGAGRPAGVMTIGEDVTDRKVLLKLLVEQEKQSRAQVISEVQKARALEREDLAFELHDNISQVLTTCKLLLEQELTASQSPFVHQAFGLVQSAIADVRALSHRLYPEPIYAPDFKLVLKRFIDQVALASGINFKLNLSGMDAVPKSAMVVFSGVFRIIQEQVNNIIKHAQASRVLISLQVDEATVNLEVKDDGIGFDLSKSKKGLGLKSINSRVNLQGGTVYIDTSLGQGCLVSVCIPLPEQAGNAAVQR